MPIQFPSRDLTSKYVSSSYQDVVQRFDTGSTEYLLDGLGFAILSIPSASLGNNVITSDQTASYANISTLAIVADVALIADTASFALTSSFLSSSQTFVSSQYSTNKGGRIYWVNDVKIEERP